MKPAHYPYTGTPPFEGATDPAFPDAVVDAFVKEGAKRAAGLHWQEQAGNNGPDIELKDAKQLIIDALMQFDKPLAARAALILNDPQRLNLQEADKGIMMRVRAAGLTPQDAMSFEGHPDYAALKKAFPDDHNPKDYSIIDYQYDKTVKSVIYLAHELGHAIADDYQLSSRHFYRENPAHMMETQAYLVQAIATNFLKNHPDENISTEAKRLADFDVSRSLLAIPLGLAAMDAQAAINEGQPVKPAAIFIGRFGKDWENMLAEDNPASKTFAALEALNTNPADKNALKVLENDVNRLHDRPAAMFSGFGIAALLQGKDQDTIARTSETLLGLHGPKGISETLAVAGIGEQELPGFAKSLFDKTFSSPAPAQQENTRKQASAFTSKR